MYFSTPVLSSFVLASGVMSQMSNMGSSTNTMMMTPSGTSDAATPSGSTKVHVINVSDKNGSLIYSPASTTIPVGDMVQWHFYPKNHSVVQAAFSNPCEPLSNVMPNVTTFYSGYMPVSKNDTMMPALTMMVKSTMPFWYYCSQGNHCQDGMVGVINPPAPSTGKTIDAFTQKAKTAPKSTIPTNSTISSSSNSTSSSSSPSSSGGAAASKSASAAAAPATTSAATFPGAGNNLVIVGLTTFVGLGLAFLL